MKNKTNTYVILASLLTLLSIGGFVYMVNYIDGLTQKSALLFGEIEIKEAKLRNIQNINKSAEKTTEDRETIMNHFVKADSSIDFVSMLELTAANFALKHSINSIENTEMENLATQDKQLLRISMTLTGGWRNVLKFLTYVESLPYALYIEKVELSSEGGVADVTSTVASTQSASSTGENKTLVARQSNWKLNITFSVVKVKDKK